MLKWMVQPLLKKWLMLAGDFFAEMIWKNGNHPRNTDLDSGYMWILILENGELNMETVTRKQGY